MKQKSVGMLLLVALVLSLGWLQGVAMADPGVIAGNVVEDRASGPDTWQNFYIVDRNNGFSEDSFMTGFSVFIKEKDSEINPFEFMVYAENAGVWEVIYRSGVITPLTTDIYTAATIDPVFVPAGSYVGLYYPEQGAVPYTNGPLPHTTILDKALLFTDQGGTEVDFLYSDDRVYSIAATGYLVSEYEARISGGGQILAESTDQSDKDSKKKSDDNFKISFGVGAYIIDGQYFLKSCEVTFHNVGNNDIDKWKFVGDELTGMNFNFSEGVANFDVSGYLEDENGVNQGDASIHIPLQDSGEPAWLDNIRFQLSGAALYDSRPNFPGDSTVDGTNRTVIAAGNLQVEDLR